MRNLSVSLTDAGRQALSGLANAVKLNGIDDWIAGVHLDSSTGNVWFASGGNILC